LHTIKSGTIQEIGRNKWDSFVESHPHGSIYHCSRWHDVIKQAYSHEARYHVVLDGDGKIRSGIPSAVVRNLFLGRRLVAFPYSDYCDPLIGVPGDFKTLLDSMNQHVDREKAQSCELRAYKTIQAVPDKSGETAFCNFVLAIDQNPAGLFSKFHKSCVQRAIRKAERADLEVVEGNTLDDMYDFYRLHVSTRKRQGVPAQPFRFFKYLWDEFSSRGQLSLLLARNSGRLLAALVLLRFKDTTYYKFGASDPHFFRLCANQLLFWRAIQDANQGGCKWFEFGRTSKSKMGLVKFKQRWGAQARDLHYTSMPSYKNTLDSIEHRKLATISGKLLRMLPEFMTRFSGSVLYRYLG